MLLEPCQAYAKPQKTLASGILLGTRGQPAQAHYFNTTALQSPDTDSHPVYRLLPVASISPHACYVALTEL